MTAEELSNIAGGMSIACWIVVYSPQMWENYLLKSGEGLSVTFIILWLLGDLTNLAGGVMAKLLPTVIILASYYTLCDVILLIQVYYYRHLARTRPERTRISSSAVLESTPLIDNGHVHPVVTQPKPLLPPFLEYPIMVSFVLLAGLAGWFLSSRNTDVTIPEHPGKGQEVELEWKSQLLGYMSAALYLGSRVPQIAHNYKTRCAGLSLAMFFFSISGNVTYVFSILLVSTEKRYLIANASWLAGSGLTIFLDLFVMAQFAVFNMQDKKMEREGKVFVNDDGQEREEESA